MALRVGQEVLVKSMFYGICSIRGPFVPGALPSLGVRFALPQPSLFTLAHIQSDSGSDGHPGLVSPSGDDNVDASVSLKGSKNEADH